jgi:hypothetical protein
MDVSLFLEWCVVEVSATGLSLAQRVLPSVICLSVIEKPHGGDLVPIGLYSKDKKIY